MDKTLFIPVGIPGSGKTTLWEDRIKKNYNWAVRVSPDDIRRNILDSYNTGVFFDKLVESVVWNQAYSELDGFMMLDSKVIYFDATNLTWRARWNISSRGKRNGYWVVCLHLYIHPKLAFLRNTKRENPVPHEAMTDMLKSYKSPNINLDPYIDEIQTVKLLPSKEERVEMRGVKLV